VPPVITPRKVYTPYIETPTDWTPTVELSNKNKKDIVVFLAAGAAALLIRKIEKIINKKADEYFPDDEESQDN
jgi:hypothetical protein